jgi:hypothetical protein
MNNIISNSIQFDKTMNMLVGTLMIFITTSLAADWSQYYDLTVLPPEHRIEQDKEIGAVLLFLTSHPSKDINLYYHQRSWLSNSSAILFYSEREPGGLYAYWIKTGELLSLKGPDGDAFTGVTASVHRNSVYAVWNNKAVEIEIKVQPASKESQNRSKAQARFRIICELKPNNRRYNLNESCDGKYLAYDTMGHGKNGGPAIFIVNVETGDQTELVSLPPNRGSANHVQWSRTNPRLLSFSSLMEPYKSRAGPRTPSKGPTDYIGRCQRLWVIDISKGVPPRKGKFIDYTGKNATTRSYHLSLSRYNDKGEHTGVSNWRRNPGLALVGQGPDPCEKTGEIYHVAIIKRGALCQLQVNGDVVSGFIDDQIDEEEIPRDGKIGFRAIGALAVVRIANLKVTALD